MTSVATAQNDGKQRVEVAVDQLREAATKYLEANERTAPLRKLFESLRETGYADDLISRALSAMLSRNELWLTSDRRVVLPDGSSSQ